MAVSVRCLCLLALLLPSCLFADEKAELNVRPLLCIVDERTPICDLDFLIDWRMLTIGSYCVRTADDSSVLRCWENAERGDTTDRRQISETFSYLLHTAGESDRLAEATVEVVQKAGDDRRRRRRTRHVWDIL